ncbi:MAG TPA: glycosyl transferase [Lactobacillus sp.]|nr:glycosyl transferase [Lactobacillus sp.]
MNFFTNEAMGIGNSGVEHAEFYRAKLFKRVDLPYKFLFTNLVEDLHEAMDKWNLKPNEVINMWEYFVFGNDYALYGLQKRVKPNQSVIVDNTHTNRLIHSVTSSGMRVVKHLIKYPNPDKPGTLLVSVQRIEIFDKDSGQKKAAYEVLKKHKNSVITNIHLFNQPDGAHIFFDNEIQLRRYFFNRVSRLFDGQNVFVIDRGEASEVALMTHRESSDKLIAVIHADHLSDRADPKNPFWNNYYEYELSHLDELDAVVVATKMQRNDLLIDFPAETDKVKAIPVGGIDTRVVSKKRNQVGTPLRLITMSRLAAEKHIDLITRAVIRLHDAGIQILFDIYGGGGEYAKIAKIIKEANAEGYIALKGQTNHPADAYLKYDAFISASFSEGFGLTYVEALNSGLPVVTFDARFGAQELIKDGENGFLLDFKRGDDEFDVEQLIKGIRRLQKANYSALQANIKNYLQPYQEQKIAEQWRKLIDEL